MKEYKITVKKFFGHLHTVNHHRWKVFCLCCKVGIPFQGLVHDLSKYSPDEFWEGVKYYQGNYSPIRNCKEVEGYSKAWLHHKGRNKHHYEYWYDYATPIESPVMPLKYYLEMVCDTLAAGMTYQGDKWDQHYQLKYWHRVKDKAIIHPKMAELLEKTYEDISEKGLKVTLTKKYLSDLYYEITSK